MDHWFSMEIMAGVEDPMSASGPLGMSASTFGSAWPFSSPHPRVLVGGGGERNTLRLDARDADDCNLFASSPADRGHKLEVTF
jgi:hypothetical protein